MHMLVDMASSPQYLAPSAQSPEHIDIDPRIATLPGGSCSGIAPSTVAYSTSDHTSYSEVSRLSPFETSSVFDEHLLTPVSSAASPELQQRSCKQSPFLHHRELTPCHQQPTPPHSTVMYSYPDYTTTTSSMPMQTAAVADAAAPHELLSYHLHGSPGHHGEQQQAPPPPPQSQPYFGSYSVSVPQEPVPEHYYLQGGTIDNPLGLLRADVSSSGGGSSFTHRALAPLAQASPSMAPTTMIHHHQQPAPPPQYSSRRELDMALPKLSSPPTHSRHTSLSLRRDPARKTKARRSNSSSNNNSSGNNRRDSSYSPPAQGQYQFGEEVMAAEGGGAGDNGPDEEVTLDDKTPADLRRLWDTRRKWLGKKGNGMWEDIMVEYLGEEGHSENKKTQVKAALQMKIHRMLLKHAEWPARDNAALLRAYKRHEENRYNEILRMYEEEMSGQRKAYEWKSQHIEAQLVKLGLEEKERDRDSKARKRKQVAARHQGRAAAATAGALRGVHLQQHHHHHTPLPPPAAVRHHPGMYDPANGYHHYAQAAPAPVHYDARFEAASLAERLGVQPPTLTDEQQERLIEEVLDRDNNNELDGQQQQQPSDDVHDQQQREYNAVRPRAASSIMDDVIHHHHQSPDLHAQRDEAVARGTGVAGP